MEDPRNIVELLDCPLEEIDWDAIVQRATNHGEDFTARRNGFSVGGVYWRTLLHRVVTLNPPVKAARAVIRAYPEALATTYKDRNCFLSPLGLACETGASVDIIRMMFQETWRAIENRAINEDKTDCLVWMIEVFKPLIECCGFWEPSFRLDHMRVWMEEVPHSFERMDSYDTKSCLDHLFKESFANHDGYWDKLNLILMRLTMGVTRQEELASRTFLVLHSVLELLCRVAIHQDPFEKNDTSQTIFSFLHLVQQHSADQFRTRDDSGSLPLHIVAQLPFKRNDEDMYYDSSDEEKSSSDDSDEQALCDDDSNDEDSSSDEDLSIVMTSSDEESSGGGHLPEPVINDHTHAIMEILLELLEEYPESAGIADGRGRLPLHIAVERGQP